MVDSRALIAGLVVVAAVALGMAAGGVDSIDPDTEVDEHEPPESSSPTPTPSPGERSESEFDPWCPGPLSTAPGLAAGFLALGAAAALGYRRTGSVLVPALVVTPTSLYLLLACGSALPSVGPALDAVGGVLGTVFGAPLLLAAGAALALAGAVAFLYVRGETGTFADADAWAADEAESDLTAVAEAAGAAADRIEGQADVSNEVYRAWVEMTRHLDVAHPETTAPDEFAEAAVEAGMAADDVATLTRLFQDVRYGGADPDARAEAAVEALRAIEDAYGGDGS